MLPAVQAHVTGPIPAVSVLPGGCFSLTGQPRTQRHRRVLHVRQHMAVSVSLCRARFLNSYCIRFAVLRSASTSARWYAFE
jgi:hypothetical protein